MQFIIARIAIQHVVPGKAIKPVISATATDDVIAPLTIKKIISGSAV